MDELPSTELLDIPDLVLEQNLFPYLHLDDLLRLRRVCKTTKLLVEEHLRLHRVHHLREIEITEEDGDKSLSAFLAMNIPTARIYLNIQTVKFFEHERIPEFLELYAHKVTHLRVHHYFTCTNETEKPFYESFRNLQRLELEEIDARKWNCGIGVQMPRHPEVPIPSSFKNLRTLKFGHVRCSSAYEHGYWEHVVMRCYDNMEYLGHPRYAYPTPSQDVPYIGILLDMRRRENSIESKLQFYDLDNLRKPSARGFNFANFLVKCYNYGFKMLNVDSKLLSVLLVTEWDTFQKAVIPLVSVRNLARGMFQWELPNLEKVVVTSTSKSGYYPFWKRYENESRPLWPKLKTIDLTVDSVEMAVWECMQPIEQDVAGLLEFFFEDVVRTEVTELALRFDDLASRRFLLPCPKAVHIKASCPNLKMLTLVNWVGTNKTLSRLWDGLEHLEEIVIQDCRDLGNVAFVGERIEEPTFLKLKKLKTLCLKGLHLMPKITDTVFRLVFRHMKLTKFYLESRRPLETITERGIASLLSGDFAGSIKKFPFKGWSLADVPEKDFKELEQQFRSYFMV